VQSVKWYCLTPWLLLLLASCQKESTGHRESAESPAPVRTKPKPPEPAPDPPKPDPVTLPPSPVAELVAGNWFVAARLEDGSIWWWGHALDAAGQAVPLPLRTPFPEDVISMSAAHGHSYLCMVRAGGTVICRSRLPLMDGRGWGDTWSRSYGIDLTGPLRKIVSVGASEYEGCAIGQDHGVVCWSYMNRLSLLPKGKTRLRIKGIGKVEHLAVGSGHACALNRKKEVWCWGSGNWGELGNPDYTGPTAKLVLDHTRREVSFEGLAGPQPPRRVTGLDRVSGLVAGGSHNCALCEGRAWCWGFNASKQLGDGTHKARARPEPVAGVEDVVELAAGHSTTCARKKNGTVMCWGHDLKSDVLGHDYTTAPYTVPGLDDATMIAVGGIVACAVRKSGAVACWGSNRFGSLGNAVAGASDLTHVRWDIEPSPLPGDRGL
jgi:hypothetical protein